MSTTRTTQLKLHEATEPGHPSTTGGFCEPLYCREPRTLLKTVGSIAGRCPGR